MDTLFNKKDILRERNLGITIDNIEEQLLERFPNIIPTVPTTERELARLQGQQDVIKYITNMKESYGT